MSTDSLWYSYCDGPSVCAPAPRVVKSIRKELAAARAISAHEARVASMMGLAPAGTSNSMGFNDGVIYPPGFELGAADKKRSPVSRAALAPQASRKLHALALLVDFSDNKGVRPSS